MNKNDDNKEMKFLNIVLSKVNKKYDISSLEKLDVDNILQSFIKVYTWENENKSYLYNVDEFLFDEEENIDSQIINKKSSHITSLEKTIITSHDTTLKKTDISLFRTWSRYSSNHISGEREKIKQTLDGAIKENINLIKFMDELSECYQLSKDFIIFILKNPFPYDASLNEKIVHFNKIKNKIPKP